MTKAKLIKRLKELQVSSDYESAHWDADEAVITYINDAEIAEEYNKIHKWYA